MSQILHGVRLYSPTPGTWHLKTKTLSTSLITLYHLHFGVFFYFQESLNVALHEKKKNLMHITFLEDPLILLQ